MRFILFISSLISLSTSFTFNTIIKRNINDTMIRFIKLNNINNYKICDKPNYLIIKFDREDKSKIFIENPYEPINILNENDEIINSLKPLQSHSQSPRIPIKSNKYDYSIYNYIKMNKKPMIIISKEFNKTYLYHIIDKNNFVCTYRFKYNNNNYKYHMKVRADEISDNETFWYVDADVNLISNLRLLGIQLINWINYLIDNNMTNYYFKKYLISSYYLNLER